MYMLLYLNMILASLLVTALTTLIMFLVLDKDGVVFGAFRVNRWERKSDPWLCQFLGFCRFMVEYFKTVFKNLSFLFNNCYSFYISYHYIFTAFYLIIVTILFLVDLYGLITTGYSFIRPYDSYVYNILPESSAGGEEVLTSSSSSSSSSSSGSSSNSVGDASGNASPSRGHGQSFYEGNEGGNREELPTFNEWLTLQNKFLKNMDTKNLPSEYTNPGTNNPVYGPNVGKIGSQSSGLLARRGLKAMNAGLPPAERQTGREFLKLAKRSERLYLKQSKKFEKTINKIDSGKEQFYPASAKTLFREYLDVLPHLRTFWTDIKINLKAAIRRSRNN